ncbi:TNF-receptor-like protein CrmE [Cotia virus SPAn232]|uniref:TNF-receptor-like protein CrmE n=2 Tax=Cotia virus TaxID=39444 RepID=H6TAG1_9POXV|nr:TNF-receptor-like protein CrmE [Cotia virus SPAn232]YP_005296366.1 TNF-receptor-like protein CrmE [Cotia virus SPAn232]AIT70623.1 TNF-receptor-like protein CrmE [Cotia virus]AFB76898.1 TNF-receptor-like protein CrmE [Cotia virus SPAn232]AFB76980.1 TNF-receptor-like protein CrmE [Cotia virus SPAn232]AIT70793.1 TNF-receptor-like protein CrmE [Cotia virus]
MYKYSNYILYLLILVTVARSSDSKCGVSEYYNKEHDICCRLCPAGSYAEQLCTKDNDTVCNQCPPNTFLSIPNYISSCLSCRGKCINDHVEDKPCTATSNRICKCKENKTCVLKTYDNSCRVCI